MPTFNRSLLLLLLILAAPVLGHAPDKGAATAPAPHRQDRTAQDETMSLLDVREKYANAPATERGQRMSDLLNAARSRRQTLDAMAETDPEEVLRVALPADIRSRFPSQALGLLESDADEEGELEVYHVDHVDPLADHYEYFLRTGKERLSLHFARNEPKHAAGTRLKVRGVRVGSKIVLADGAAATLIGQAAQMGSPTLGAQKTLAILVNFGNAPTQPFTLAYANDVIFSTTSNYDYENSYQQTTLAGTVAGWFTIAESSASCNYTNIATQAQQAAQRAGYALTDYARFVYVFPPNSCGWWGLGSVGGYPSQAWIHSKWGFNLNVVGHEMGHNFGLYHSHSLDCGSVSIAAGGCTASEYGDYFDLMGSSNGTPHYSAYQKEVLGWLNAGVSPPITTVAPVAGTTLYTIAPIEDARNGAPRALKIPRGTSCTVSNEWLYVESRQAKGFDAYLATNANTQSGVLIHKVSGIDLSYLLDMTPETTAWADAALVAGRAFTDPESGVTITPLSVGGSSSTIAVNFPAAACTHGAPKVTLSPAGTAYATPGSSVNYAVSVQNGDGCTCTGSTFDVILNVPTGWSATTSRTSSIAPGLSGTVSVVVTSPASAAAAFYPVTVTAANSAAQASTGSASATIAIAVAAPMTVSVSTDKSSYALPRQGKNANAAITARASSNGVAVVGAAVSVQVSGPTGAITNLSGTTDRQGNAKVTYVVTSTSVKGSYSVSSTVANTSMSGTANTSFVVK